MKELFLGLFWHYHLAPGAGDERAREVLGKVVGRDAVKDLEVLERERARARERETVKHLEVLLAA
jgi:hypothetical protein